MLKSESTCMPSIRTGRFQEEAEGDVVTQCVAAQGIDVGERV